jgi:hypothetical protein
LFTHCGFSNKKTRTKAGKKKAAKVSQGGCSVGLLMRSMQAGKKSDQVK